MCLLGDGLVVEKEESLPVVFIFDVLENKGFGVVALHFDDLV